MLEAMGFDLVQDEDKRSYLNEWVRAVNAHGGFGHWSWETSTNPSDVMDKVLRHSETDLP